MSDRLSDHRILIIEASTVKRDDHCTLQLSKCEATATESEVNTLISLEVIRKAQSEDDSSCTVIQYLKAGAPPSKSDLRHVRGIEVALCTMGFSADT